MQKQLLLKFLAVLVVGLIILISVGTVKYKVYERQGYQQQAIATVASSWTGSQLVVSPVLVIPYRIKTPTKAGFYTDQQLTDLPVRELEKLKIVLPVKLNNSLNVDNSSVFKGIYEIPVYASDIVISGEFQASAIRESMAALENIAGYSGREHPYIAIHISDTRGIELTPQLRINADVVALNPGSKLPVITSGLHAFADVQRDDKPITFDLNLALRGMETLSLVTLADSANTEIKSNWPHPKFIGATLPNKRAISQSGFTASWTSSRYSSDGVGNIYSCIEHSDCSALRGSSSGVAFIEPVDIYLQSERSIKYAMLFIGLSFITFFIFENLTSQRIHPIQYTFVGLSIAIFYLLLLSLAEHIAFHWAYLIACVCSISLTVFYVRYMLRGIKPTVAFNLMLATLYGLLFVIVQAEDFALLMGSVLVFTVLAILMYVTRKIDWYSLGPEKPAGAS